MIYKSDRSVQPSTRPWSSSVQLLNRKGLWTSIESDEPTVEPDGLSGSLWAGQHVGWPKHMWALCSTLGLQQPTHHQPAKPISSLPTAAHWAVVLSVCGLMQLCCIMRIWTLDQRFTIEWYQPLCCMTPLIHIR